MIYGSEPAIIIWLKRVIKSLTYLAWAGISFEILMLVTDLSGRYFLNRPLPASVKMSELILPYVVFTALAYTLAVGGHIRVTVLLRRLPRIVQSWCEILACTVGIVLFSLLTYQGWLHFWKSFIVKEDMLAPIYLPWYVGKFIFPIGCAFFCIQFLMNLVTAVRQLVIKSK